MRKYFVLVGIVVFQSNVVTAQNVAIKDVKLQEGVYTYSIPKDQEPCSDGLTPALCEQYGRCEANVHYPQIIGSSKFIEDINEKYKTMAQKYFCKIDPPDSSHLAEATFTYEVKYTDQNVISFLFFHWARWPMGQGSCHGGYFPATYDISQERQLTLKDVTNNWQAISLLIEEKAKKNNFQLKAFNSDEALSLAERCRDCPILIEESSEDSKTSKKVFVDASSLYDLPCVAMEYFLIEIPQE